MTRHDSFLRSLLKRHDPAARDAKLTEDERIRMRRAVVSAAGHPKARTGLSRWVAAGVLTAAMVAAALGLWPRLRLEPPAPSRVAGHHPREPREVHIVTPGGTQVVWILNPDLRL